MFCTKSNLSTTIAGFFKVLNQIAWWEFEIKISKNIKIIPSKILKDLQPKHGSMKLISLSNLN